MRARPKLLVFTLGPSGDCERRPLLPPRLKALDRRLRAFCLDRTIEAGRSIGMDVLVSTRDDVPLPHGVARARQRGSTFGTRLANALSNVSGLGTPIVLVGSDTPALSATQVRQAVELVAADDDAVVIGPSADGGFYLLACGRPIDGLLERVRWCRSSTTNQLVALLEEQGRRVVFLETLRDLDTPQDLAGALREVASLPSWIVGQIRTALQSLFVPRSEQPAALHPALVLLVESHRGPPA